MSRLQRAFALSEMVKECDGRSLEDLDSADVDCLWFGISCLPRCSAAECAALQSAHPARLLSPLAEAARLPTFRLSDQLYHIYYHILDTLNRQTAESASASLCLLLDGFVPLLLQILPAFNTSISDKGQIRYLIEMMLSLLENVAAHESLFQHLREQLLSLHFFEKISPFLTSRYVIFF